MQNKNLKLSLCGLALTSFLALNTHSIVHADTVQNGNANDNAITWDSDNDDSQVVKSEPQQAKASQTVQKQAPVQSHVQVSYSQPAQKKVMVADVSSAPSSQKRAETSIVRQSNFETSTVNRLNADNRLANIKVSSVQDVAQAPVQKQKVAQFNNGSKIYTLNGSNQLSKNNGDGYVITNAGTYNGRAVDIGVTINGVQDNQGTYTTKWSNGDKADVTGKTDASFNYQDSVLLSQQQDNVTVPDKTRTRTETQTKSEPYDYNFEIMSGYGAGGYHAFTDVTPDVIDYLKKNNNDLEDALQSVVDDHGSASVYEYWGMRGGLAGLTNTLNNASPWNNVSEVRDFSDGLAAPANGVLITSFSTTDDSGEQFFGLFGYKSSSEKPHMIDKSINTDVTDHLQLANKTDASLNYNYTVGLYDAQTGDLIGDLKAEYKGKVGVQATPQDSVMNNAIKSKIQQINNNQAAVSYTGTQANDDVAFYKETRAVNPQDQSLHKSATRIISVNLPDDQGARDRYKGMLNDNNQIVQTINFTRTGVENVVNGQVTYGAWQGPSSFGAVTLPDIPGYTMSLS